MEQPLSPGQIRRQRRASLLAAATSFGGVALVSGVNRGPEGWAQVGLFAGACALIAGKASWAREPLAALGLCVVGALPAGFLAAVGEPHRLAALYVPGVAAAASVAAMAIQGPRSPGNPWRARVGVGVWLLLLAACGRLWLGAPLPVWAGLGGLGAAAALSAWRGMSRRDPGPPAAAPPPPRGPYREDPAPAAAPAVARREPPDFWSDALLSLSSAMMAIGAAVLAAIALRLLMLPLGAS